MSSVSKFILNEILRIAEASELSDSDTLSSLGFSSNDFAKVWESTKKTFPGLQDMKLTQWSLDVPVVELLQKLSLETAEIK